MYVPLTSLLMICAAATFAAGLAVAQRWLVASVARRFTRLPRFEQALLVVAICVTTVCAQKSGVEKVEVEDGSDEVEVRGGGGEWMLTIRSSPRPLASALMNSVGRDVLGTPLSQGSSANSNSSMLRAKNSQTETNVFSITSFTVDRANCAVSFTAAWTSNLFDSVDSRNVDLFSSTNLLERRWASLGALAMPSGTNACAFVVVGLPGPFNAEIERASETWRFCSCLA